MKDISEVLLHSIFIKQKGYWEKKLSPHLARTEFKPCHEVLRGGKKENEPGNFGITFSPGLCAQLMRFSKGSDLSIYIVLLTVLKILVYRYSNNPELTVISPVYTPNISEDTLNNMVFIHVVLNPNMPFIELVLGVRQSVLEAYENQDYPYGKLIEYLFTAEQLKTIPGLSNIICLSNNIHDRRMIEEVEGKDKIVFSFKREADRIFGNIEYPPDIYDKNFIRRFSSHYARMLENSLSNIKTKIAGLSFSLEEENRQLLDAFNRTQVKYPWEKTIHQLFEEQVEQSPDAVAAVSGSQVTYRQLNKQSDRLAGLLKAKGAGCHTIVGLIMERSIEMIVGILGILKAGSAYLPIDPGCPAERIQYILKDSGAVLLLTTGSDFKPCETIEIAASQVSIVNCQPQPFPGIPSSLHPCFPSPGPSNLAYIIYTSGTTGQPRGVMVEHRAVVNYICWAARQYVRNEKVNFPLFTSISFDLTVTSIFVPLVTGNAIVVYAEGYKDNQLSIEKIIGENKVAAVKLTPSHLQMMRDMDIKGHSNIKRFIVGGEDFKSTFAEDINRNFPAAEIYNEYGPTEATVGCMIYRFDPVKDRSVSVPIGLPIANTRVYILDAVERLVPPGIVGEIYIGGAGVAAGYLNQPKLTAERFVYSPFTLHTSLIYKTGDLARWLPDGNIEFLGRIDHQVKIRGFRIELGEIENQLLKHEQIKEAVVIERKKNDGDNYLCVYTVGNPGSSAGDMPGSVDLKRYLSRVLPDYMIPLFFINLDKIPLTLNGKLDRRALPEPDPRTLPGKYAGPRDDIERKLVEIWSEILAIAREKIDIHDNFFYLGGHSLKATLLAGGIHKELNVNVPLTEVFNIPTLKDLAVYIKKKTHQYKYISIEPTEIKEYYPLSSAQKRLYFLHQMENIATAYNIPAVVSMDGDLKKNKLEDTFKKLINRHESLRTAFELIQEEPVQKIHQKVEFKIESLETAAHKDNQEVDPVGAPGNRVISSINEIIDNFVRPFDLSRAPLLRVGLIKLEKQKHILMMEMHHIISDGTSMDIFVKDFMALYNGQDLPKIRIQYKDFSQWQRHLSASGEMKKQEEYWFNRFKDNIPVLIIPTDYPRPSNRRYTGDTIWFEIHPGLTAKIRDLEASTGTTSYMILLAVCNILLAKYSDQEDIVVGTSISGRNHADLQNIIGMLVNMLSLRNQPQMHKTFREFLQEVKENALAAFENQNYQFDELIISLGLQGSFQRNPLCNVVFTMQNMGEGDISYNFSKEGDDLHIYSHEYNYGKAKFDLLFVAFAVDDTFRLRLEYSTELFNKRTAEKIARYYIEILKQVLDNHVIKLKDITISHNLIAIKSNILENDLEEFDL